MTRSRIFKLIVGAVGLVIIGFIGFLTYFLVYSSESESAAITKQIFYYHYARHRPDTPIELKTGVPLNSSINPKLPWKFFVHGWTTSPWVSPWFQTGKAAYFQHGEYNVVFVDWSKPANETYLVSVLYAKETGKVFGKFIAHLHNNGVSLHDIHLLGHSLGSHMVAFAGKYMRDKVKKIGRITGLDPAAPFYETSTLLDADSLLLQHTEIVEKIRKINPYIFHDKKFLVPPSQRLSDDDALFVDIIHTAATQYGMESVIGHCDFFPNSGYPIQPGCENTGDDNCSHARSVTFFVESINSNNFVARKCSSYEEYEKGKCKNNTQAVMGEHTDHKTRGVYYLKTNSSPPYGRGHCKECRRRRVAKNLTPPKY